jgi:hypothetical protein
MARSQIIRPQKAWPSITHTILSGLTPWSSSGLLWESGRHGRRRGASLHRLHVPHGGIWPPVRPLLLPGQLKSVMRIRILDLRDPDPDPDPSIIKQK